MEKHIYTVTQVNNMVKVAVESNLPPRISVAGEITSYRPASGGHKYFVIKDENSQLPSVMWKSAAAKSKFQFVNGAAVVATGFVDVYAPFGKYQFVVDTINPAGVGNLQLIFERLVARLESEGLFDHAHKKPIPKYPMRIGIITSPTGAAVEDIVHSIRSRFQCVKLMLYPVPVQGKGAEIKIAAAIADVNARNDQLKLDLIIVGRGGGSLEDLWCFNEEAVARAIFASKIPVISAVGHEIDTTIADLVADARASTPTRAGVIAVPDMSEMIDQMAVIQRRLKADIAAKLNLCKQKLATIQASIAFRTPGYAVQMKGQRVDELEWRIREGFGRKIGLLKTGLDGLTRKVGAIEPHRLIAEKNLQLQKYENRLSMRLTGIINGSKLKLTAQQNRLQSLDPRSVLQRGYTITLSDETGKVLDGTQPIEAGKLLRTEFGSGKTVRSRVE